MTSDPKRDGHARGRQFGAFGGVFTPCMLTILGVILFMRSNFAVGQAGIANMILILVLAKSITFFTTLSVSAVCTNMKVRGGGAYYLISRVLGPEFGGGIGAVLFIAQALSVPFYVLGFTEALLQTVPDLQPHGDAIAFGTAAALFVVAYIGAGWAIKVQFVIMAVLFLAIAAFMAGALPQWSLDVFRANWAAGYTLVDADVPASGSYSYWRVFAIYFPAVTGIMAGINMSGDLRDPARAIPRGTLAAVGAGFLIYLAQMLVFGGAFAREALIAKPYLLLQEHALFGAGFLVAAGVWAATLSSGLGSFMGAPRVLQAVARDRIFPLLGPFAKGSRGNDEPRPAILATAALTFVVLFWAAKAPGRQSLNIVAKTITMFFLYTYGMLNVAAFIEAVGQNPSFRPRFRFFHWGAALAGGAGCIAVALIISPVEAVVAFGVLSGAVLLIRRRELEADFGDARRGFLYSTVRNSLLGLADMRETPRNWRPTSLVFSGNPASREALVRYAVWLEGGRGIVYLANILVGGFDKYGPRRGAALAQLERFCEEQDLPAFPVVLVDEDLEHGMAALMQALRVGPIGPNLAVFGWSGEAARLAQSIAHFRRAKALGMSLVVIDAAVEPPPEGPKRVDLWWRGMDNGGLMVLLAHLLTRNWAWSRARLRLLRQIGSEAGRAGTMDDLRRLVDAARIDAEITIIVSERPFAEILESHSAGSACVFLGFDVPEEGGAAAWHARNQALIAPGRTTVFVSSTGLEDLMA